MLPVLFLPPLPLLPPLRSSLLRSLRCADNLTPAPNVTLQNLQGKHPIVSFRSGRHFLQLPGPTNVPDRVLRAMDRPTIDHRGPEFAKLVSRILDDLAQTFGDPEHVFIYPASASGAWEAALVNTLSPGDRVLACVNGFFAEKWRAVAERLGLAVEVLEGDWRRAVDPEALRTRLEGDGDSTIKAVTVVHNETSTGVTTSVPEIRRAIDGAKHHALLMVDAVSSLASLPYEHRSWNVDVTVAGSQKGLMLPPGLSFTAVSQRALDAHRSAGLPRAYWDWSSLLEFNARGFFPYTPATNLLFGLREALTMLREEGSGRTFARHRRFADATRLAVRAWTLDCYGTNAEELSDTVTTVEMPDGVDAEAFRHTVLDRFDMSLGTGLGPLKGKVFRIGHLGDLNELMLLGTLAGIEMGFRAAAVPSAVGGVQAAMDYLSTTRE